MYNTWCNPHEFPRHPLQSKTKGKNNVWMHEDIKYKWVVDISSSLKDEYNRTHHGDQEGSPRTQAFTHLLTLCEISKNNSLNKQAKRNHQRFSLTAKRLKFEISPKSNYAQFRYPQIFGYGKSADPLSGPGS